MAIDFPASPTLNDVFTVGNVTYVWDGTKWTASVTGGISLDKIEEGNTSAEVIDTGSDGRFVVTTEGTGRLFVDASGNVGVGLSSIPNYNANLRTVSFNNTNGVVHDYAVNGTRTGSIVCQSTGFDLTTQTNIPLIFSTNSNERMRITSAGLVGIGTSSPSVSLHVVGGGMFASSTTGGSIVQARNSDFSSLGYFGVEGSTGGVTLTGTLANSTFISSGASGTPLQFGTGGVIRSTLTSTGLGIGTTNPGSVCHVAGSNGDGLTVSGGGATGVFRSSAAGTELGSTSGDNTVFLSGSGTERVRIDSSGRVGIGTTSPGMKLTINDTTTAQIQLGYNDSIYGRIGRNSSGNYEFSSYENGGNLLFGTTGTTGSTTERVRIDSIGRLLVGTSSAVSTQWAPNLQVVGADTPCSFVLARNDTTVAVNTTLAAIRAFGNSSSGPYEECSRISTEADGDHGPGDKPTRLAFWTTADGASTPTERMRIASNGIIVARNSVGDTLNLYNAASAGTSNAFIYGAHSSASAYTGTTSFVVWTNGNVVNTNGSYTTISDAKLKENIVSAGSQWNDIKAIQIRNWNFKAETGNETHRQIGPIAQEVEAVCPGLVFEIPDRDQDGNETGEVTKGINQSVLYMKAVKALQEAIAKIETLEGMVAVNNITIDEQQHQLSTLAARLTALENA
jgi:hypothetical protein